MRKYSKQDHKAPNGKNMFHSTSIWDRIAPTHSTALEYQQASGIGWQCLVSKRAFYLKPCISPEREYCPFPHNPSRACSHVYSRNPNALPRVRITAFDLSPITNTFLVVTTVFMIEALPTAPFYHET